MQLFISMEAERLLARLSGVAPKLQANLVRVIRRLAIEVQGAVKETKLSGQALHVRTGTLRRSINQRVDVMGENIIATVGTNVRYAAVHEFGFDGPVHVREHLRKYTHLTSADYSAAYRAGLKKDGTPRKNSDAVILRRLRKTQEANAVWGTVRAHIRNVHLPERSFLRSTLSEMAPRIRSEIRAAAAEALVTK
jgi:phage gpG-like protein